MKKIILFSITLLTICSYSQEHFTGLTNSSRVGIITVGMNPAELTNLSSRFEVNTFGTSINVSNNKIGFNDIVNGSNIEKLIFTGTDPVNMRIDAEIYGPSVAFKLLNWGFAVTTKANAKMNAVNIDVNLGDAIINNNVTNILGTHVNQLGNQRLVGTTWGEVGLSAARKIVNNDENKISVGATLKIMFPGSYSNFGLSGFDGTIKQIGTDTYLNNTTSGLNVAYSGNLANSFTNFNDYSQSIFGGINGFVGDVGVNYQRKEKNIIAKLKNNNQYKLNIGAALKNIGSMTFKNDNNYNTDYQLNIQSTINDPLGLNLNQFSNIDNLSDVEIILKDKGYLTQSPKKTDFVVKLPTLFVAYADVKLVPKVYVSGYVQQKLTNDDDNEQITAQNIITVTPRINLGMFEAYVPLSNSEISGFNGGFGFRLGGFYLGSGSVLTSLLNEKNSKQADIYLGFRWGFL